MVKKLTILGSTGSIGINTIRVVEESNGAFEIIALTANKNVELLANQAISLNAKLAVIADENLFAELQEKLAGSGIDAACGESGLLLAGQMKTDIVMSAIVGSVGLKPTIEAVKQGAAIALANKECLVCAGNIMTDMVKKYNAKLLPVDSEHNAIFQVFSNKQRAEIDSITLTASGGPLRTFSKERLEMVTPKQAIKHPKWNMGAKISVDSASMMNKGLEIIEASYLFDLPEDKIEALIHPESIVHGMVTYSDGSVLAQLSQPDMRTPIANALYYPNRGGFSYEKLSLAKLSGLTFFEVDNEKFPAINLARQALNNKDASTIIYNAANEVAVAEFLAERIAFTEVVKTVEKVMSGFSAKLPASIEESLAIDLEARSVASSVIAGKRQVFSNVKFAA